MNFFETQIIFRYFDLVFTRENISGSWTITLIQPTYKNGVDSTDPDDYRDIALISCQGKLSTSLIDNRLTEYANSL